MEKESKSLENEVIITPAADQPEVYLKLLEGKRVGLVVNQTSILTSKNNMHLVDYLMMEGVDVKKVFVPEHGFRGDADAGEAIKSEIDKSTGLPIVSLYGDNKKPSAKTLEDIDVLIYDLQDVGIRFFTYISTMHYVMESCAENKMPLLIFDRPNPNGNYIDGPVLQKGFESFVGMHPIPVVHGLTVGELAQMINGEGWLKMRKRFQRRGMLDHGVRVLVLGVSFTFLPLAAKRVHCRPITHAIHTPLTCCMLKNEKSSGKPGTLLLNMPEADCAMNI